MRLLQGPNVHWKAQRGPPKKKRAKVAPIRHPMLPIQFGSDFARLLTGFKWKIEFLSNEMLTKTRGLFSDKYSTRNNTNNGVMNVFIPQMNSNCRSWVTSDNDASLLAQQHYYLEGGRTHSSCYFISFLWKKRAHPQYYCHISFLS